MKIKMPIRFFGNYQVTVRSGDTESKEKCQKLTVLELSPGAKSDRTNNPDDPGDYQIIFP